MSKVFKIGRKTIGVLENGVFSKDVLLSKHLFRILDAWGVDSSTLHKLPRGSKIVIHELEEGKRYITTKEDFMRLGKTYLHFKQPQEDYRTQLFLKREHFTVEMPTPLTPDQIAENDYLISVGLKKKYE
jgi:hypothetical protein